jgi:hypothetical protein
VPDQRSLTITYISNKVVHAAAGPAATDSDRRFGGHAMTAADEEGYFVRQNAARLALLLASLDGGKEALDDLDAMLDRYEEVLEANLFVATRQPRTREQDLDAVDRVHARVSASVRAALGVVAAGQP